MHVQRKTQKAMQQPQLDLHHFANLPTIKPPPKHVIVGEYEWFLMPTTSRNMGPSDGMTSVPIDGRHFVSYFISLNLGF
jgi:hypothetical protein